MITHIDAHKCKHQNIRILSSNNNEEKKTGNGGINGMGDWYVHVHFILYIMSNLN